MSPHGRLDLFVLLTGLETQTLHIINLLQVATGHTISAGSLLYSIFSFLSELIF